MEVKISNIVMSCLKDKRYHNNNLDRESLKTINLIMPVSYLYVYIHKLRQNIIIHKLIKILSLNPTRFLLHVNNNVHRIHEIYDPEKPTSTGNQLIIICNNN